MHTYTHTYIYTYMDIHTQYMYTYIFAHTYTYIHTYIYTECMCKIISIKEVSNKRELDSHRRSWNEEIKDLK